MSISIGRTLITEIGFGSARKTTTGDTISAEVQLPGTFALLSHSDTSPPVLEITFEHQGFVDGDYISDTPTISAQIEDANGVDSRPENIILTKNGENVPQDEYVIAASPTNNNLLLINLYSCLGTRRIPYPIAGTRRKRQYIRHRAYWNRRWGI